MWWTDGSTTFLASNPTNRTASGTRVIMVVVYPDLQAAETAQRASGYFIPGFGPAVWSGNVAVAQSQTELASDMDLPALAANTQVDGDIMITALRQRGPAADL
jgi:hypothetical protein